MIRLDDGFQTWFQITDSADVTWEGATSFWEKRIKPPGVVGGGPNDTTTMRNTQWRTNNAKWLVTLSEMTMTVAYDPFIYEDILGTVQVNAIVDILWPDNTWLSFFGFVDEFSPAELREGEQPEAEMKVVPTNQNFNGDERAPVYGEGVYPPPLG